MTTGKARVRLDFNPTHNETVDTLKRKTAELIDLCEEIMIDHSREAQPPIRPILSNRARHVALAQTAYEEACMWAVKAATAEA